MEMKNVQRIFFRLVSGIVVAVVVFLKIYQMHNNKQKVIRYGT